MTEGQPETYVFETVPEHEIDHVAAQIRQEPHLLNEEKVIARYRAAGLDTDPDPFSDSIVDRLLQALSGRRPYSVIRIGDGEVGLLALGQEPETPTLDRFAAERTIMNCPDRFRVNEPGFQRLKADMAAAVDAADAVGVVGMWRAAPMAEAPFAESLATDVYTDIRGRAGHWRSVRLLLAMAEAGRLEGKFICSAHNYLHLVRKVGALVSAASGTICITNQPAAVASLRERFPKQRIDLMELNRTRQPAGALPDEPGFLHELEARLPDDLSGRLVLIGAGIWAETYCTWAKQRGAVAVDLGSGFDLLGGRLTRKMHRKFLETRGLTLEDILTGR
uniref:GT-D fold domain-containing protein n=1 Tax=Roseovarius indicus TaxID=540747 RepID=UPI003B51C8F7